MYLKNALANFINKASSDAQLANSSEVAATVQCPQPSYLQGNATQSTALVVQRTVVREWQWSIASSQTASAGAAPTTVT